MRIGPMVLVTLAAGSVAAADLDPEILALCHSPDLEARRTCLRQIGKAVDDRPDVRQMVALMAMDDPALVPEVTETLTTLRSAPARDEKAPDGDQTRAILSPSAFLRPRGELAVNAYQLGTYHLEYGLTPSVAVGMQTAIPIGFVPLGATVKASLPFEGGAVGAWGNALMILPLGGELDPVYLVGGGAMVTLGTTRNFVTVGGLAYHVTGRRDSDTVLLPYVNGSVQLGPRVRLNAEVWAPIALQDDGSFGFGEAVVIMWGVRIFGRDLWGDFALIDPICAGCGDVYRVIPLGIPFLNVGFRI